MKMLRRMFALLLCAALLLCVPTAAQAAPAQPGDTLELWIGPYSCTDPHGLRATCVAQWETGAHAVNVKSTASCASFIAPADGVYLVSAEGTKPLLAVVRTTNVIGPLDYYSVTEETAVYDDTFCGQAITLDEGEELIIAWRNPELPAQYNEAATITVTALGALTALTPPQTQAHTQGVYRTWQDVDRYTTTHGEHIYFFHDGPAPLYWIASFENGDRYEVELDFTCETDLTQGGTHTVELYAFGRRQTATLEFISVDDLIADIALPADFRPEIQVRETTKDGAVTAEPVDYALPESITVTFTDGSSAVIPAQESIYEEGVGFRITCPQGETLWLDAHYRKTDPSAPEGWVFRLAFYGNGHAPSYAEYPCTLTAVPEAPGPLAQLLAAVGEVLALLASLVRLLFVGLFN